MFVERSAALLCLCGEIRSATSGTLPALETREGCEVRCTHIGHRPPVEAIVIPVNDIVTVSGK